MDMINLTFEEEFVCVAQILDFIYKQGKLRVASSHGLAWLVIQRVDVFECGL